MDRSRISEFAHTDHPIAGPLGDEAVRQLLRCAVRRGDERLLDLGCGQAAWLLRAMQDYPEVRAEGVDISEVALERGRKDAVDLAVGERLVLHRQDAAGFTSPRPFDVVLSVGATHAFGGLSATLAAALRHLAPGGLALIGDAYWERPPTAGAREMLGEYEDLATTMNRVAADGWTPVYGHISTRHELDDYEWCWTGSLASWALDHPEDPDSAEALAAAARHRTEWLRDYRDCFGFVTLVLRRSPGQQ